MRRGPTTGRLWSNSSGGCSPVDFTVALVGWQARVASGTARLSGPGQSRGGARPSAVYFEHPEQLRDPAVRLLIARARPELLLTQVFRSPRPAHSRRTLHEHHDH